MGYNYCLSILSIYELKIKNRAASCGVLLSCRGWSFLVVEEQLPSRGDKYV